MAAPARTHPLARSRIAAWADRTVGALWHKGIAPKPPLEPDFLWAKGSRGFGAEDERSIRSSAEVADFRERLDRLCHSLREDARLNALGHTLAYGQLVSAIRKRHALGRMWLDAPRCAATTVAPPIIVVGQMRAGTTRVHRLLAADPRHAGTRFCDSHDPIPATPDLRPLRAMAALAIARRINPWLDTLHPFGPTRNDEEIGWLSAALSPCAFEAQWRIPSYLAFSEARGADPVYAEFARILRSDAAAMGNAARPRVLKCPQFAEDLPALLRQFPDARLVVAQRDHRAVLDSSVSLVASQMAFQSDRAEMAGIEAEWRRKLAMRGDRMTRFLAGHAGPVARVDYAALGADWRREIARIYERLEIPLTADALAAMTAEQNRSSEGAHLAHRPQIGSFEAG